MMKNYSTREDILTEELSNRSLWFKIFECTLTALVLMAAFTGNLLVCLAIKKNAKLRKIPNYYIASLAVTDLLMSSLGMPLTLVANIADGWILGEALCQYQGFVGTALGAASLLNIALLALNRYLKIVHGQDHIRYSQTKTKTVIWSIAFVWSLALLSPTTYLATGERFSFHPGKVLCIFDLDNMNRYYAILATFCFAMIPFGVTTFCYYKVFRAVRQHNKTVAQLSSDERKRAVDEIKLAKLLFITLLGFVTCWIPFVVIDVIGMFKGQYAFPKGVYTLYSTSVGLSSCVNPVIYAALNREFRTEFKRISTACLCKISPPKIPLYRSKYHLDKREGKETTKESPIS